MRRLSGATSSPRSRRRSSPVSVPGWATPHTRSFSINRWLVPSGVGPFPLGCLSPEEAADFAVAVVSSIASGMTSDSQDCLRTLYTTTNVLEFPLGLSNEREDILLTLRFLLCVTDHEAQRLSSRPGGDAMDWSPSVLTCVDEQVGIERLVDAIVVLTEDPLQLSQADEEVLQLLPACGAVEFSPAPSPEGTFDQLSQQWLQQDPASKDMIDCLLEAAPEEELDAYFAGFRPVAPQGVAECLAQH